MKVKTKDDLDNMIYLPEDQPKMYLSDELILSTIDFIRKTMKANEDAIRTIMKMEQTHREMVEGKITKAKEEKLFEEMNNQFRNKYKLWLHDLPECMLFYNEINGQKVL